MNTETLKTNIVNTRSNLFQIDRQRDQLNSQLEMWEAQLAYAQQIEQEQQKAEQEPPEA